MQTEDGGLLQRSSDAAQNSTRLHELTEDSLLQFQNIAAETERYLSAAEHAIDRVLDAGDALSFLQGIRQESGQ